MAAKAGSVPASDRDTGTNDNGVPAPLTPEQRESLFHKHKQQAKTDNAALEKAMEAVRAVRKKRNNNRSLCRADGFPLKHMDEVIELEGRADHENKSDAETRTFMFRASRLPVTGDDSEQLTFAFTPATANGSPSLDADDGAWGGRGYTAGYRGDSGDPADHEVPPERVQAWMSGWGEGQKALMAKLEEAKKIERARK